MGKNSDNKFDPKREFRKLAIKMLENIKNEYNNSGKYWENLGDANYKESEKYRLEKLSTTNLSNVKDEELAEHLEKLENAFLYTISRLPWKDRDGNCHYPVGENKVTDKFLDKVADAINGKEDQLHGENFATVLLGDAKFDNKPNIKYAVPQCIRGDITNATTFLCLFNPGSSVDDKTFGILGMKKDSFHSYYQLQGARLDHARMIDDGKANELIVSENSMVAEMNDLSENIVYTEIDAIESELKKEVKELPSNWKTYSLSLDSKEKKELNEMDDSSRINKLNELSKENPLIKISYMISSKVYYGSNYFQKYYAKSITDFKEKIVTGYINDDNFMKSLMSTDEKYKRSKLNICNLELTPIRSKGSSTVDDFINEDAISVDIILRRLCIYELKKYISNEDKPIFVFRSYYSRDNKTRWQDIFKMKVGDDITQHLENNYFLTYPNSQGKAISETGIHTINYKLKPETVNKLISDINNNSSEVKFNELEYEGSDFYNVNKSKDEIEKYVLLKLKYNNHHYKLKTAIKEKEYTNNDDLEKFDKNRFIAEIELAKRVYDYIQSSRDVFSKIVGAETSKNN